jgi:hypothetical protein
LAEPFFFRHLAPPHFPHGATVKPPSALGQPTHAIVVTTLPSGEEVQSGAQGTQADTACYLAKNHARTSWAN